MNEFALKSGGGLEGLPLGSHPEDVRSFFGSGHQSFWRTAASNPADYWPDHGVFAYYDDDFLLEAVEFSSESSPTLEGIFLIGDTMSVIIERLRTIDPELTTEAGGAISQKLGVGVWSPTDETSQPAASVITFGRGYFD